MISLDIDHFDLRRICGSGQIFRMYEREDGLFDVYSADRHLRVMQNGSRVDFYCTQEEFDGYWRRYFDLDRDYAAIVKAATCGTPERSGLGQTYDKDRFTALGKKDSGKFAVSGKKKASRDEFVARACEFGAGIRILHQDIWEMLISFIISQQKQIPSIRKCIEALCERFGEKMREPVDCGGEAGNGTEKAEAVPENGYYEWYAFPTPEAIAAGGPEGMKGLSLGYRERYIYETAVKYLSDGFPYETVENMGLDAAKAYFTSFCGVGEKVANCICLFGAGYVDAFPIDTHIKDILYREYHMRDTRPDAGGKQRDTSSRDHGLTQSDYEELVKIHFDRYKGYRGIVQQWIFAAEVMKC